MASSNDEHDLSDIPDLDTDHGNDVQNSGQRTSNRSWRVDVIDSQGNIKEKELKITQVSKLPAGEKVIIPFEGVVPMGTDADALLGGFLGVFARDFRAFPIRYDNWPAVSKIKKDNAWDETIKEIFYWDEQFEDAARSYIMKDIGKKWKDFRLRLHDTYYHKEKSFEENIANPPLGIPKDDWAEFLTYRNKRKTKEICEKNAKNRSKLTINHTGGSKKLKRRKYEMEAKTKKEISRGTLYVETHKKHDGTFINEEAQAICEKICYIESQGTTSSKPSQNDSLGQVLGVERHGRVRGMSFGVCPSQVFGSRFEKFCGTIPFSSTTGATELQLQFEVEKLQSKAASDSQLMKEMANTIALLCQKIDVPVPPTFSLVTSEPTVEDTAAQASNQEDANQSKTV